VSKSKIFILSLSLVFSAIYGYGIAKSPLPYSVIDRDGSYIVSPLELIDSFDVGIRVRNSDGCKEYFWLKDGLTAYLVCDNV
jgi:hypothetical protein